MKGRERETVNPFSPAPRVVVLKISPKDYPAYQETFANVWNALGLFQLRGCYWHLESDSRDATKQVTVPRTHDEGLSALNINVD